MGEYSKLFERLNSLTRRSDLVIAGFLVSIIFMMIIPLPTLLVDMLIATNFAVAVLLLMIGIYISSPLDFLGFPAVLLITTLSRLALSITTTRLILMQADAGEIVDAFGEFVVGGNMIVGLVIFLIITIVQFLVITKGSERVAEVSARFSLDGMPGKQMSIDGDLRAGMIDMTEAKRRRVKIEKESQLYGAMDGAMKFVKGDAIAGIIIIAVNILGGVAIGVLQGGMTAVEALQRYSVLTIGDGLIAQIPALFISITAGIIVTRVSSEETTDLGRDITGQITNRPQAILAAGGILLLFAMVPNFPTMIFLTLSAVAFVTAIVLFKRQKVEAQGSPSISELEISDDMGLEEDAFTKGHGTTLPLVVEVDMGLKEFFSPNELNAELTKLRNALYEDLGVPFPGVHLKLTSRLKDGAYNIILQEVPVVGGLMRMDKVLVTNHFDQLDILGIPYERDEDFLPHVETHWVELKYKQILEDAQIPFLEGFGILTYHMSFVLKKHAEEFIGIQETSIIMNKLEANYPELVKEVSRILPLQKVSEIFRRLVSEDISIRNLRAIMEAIVEWGPREKDIVQLTEYVRTNQKRYISHKYSNDYNLLPAYLLDEQVEETIRNGVRVTSAGSYLVLEPEVSKALVDEIKKVVGDLSKMQLKPVMLTSMDIRRYVRKLIELDLEELPVLSMQELTPDVTVQPLGRIQLEGVNHRDDYAMGET